MAQDIFFARRGRPHEGEQDHNRAALFTADIDRQSPKGTIPIAREHLAAASFNLASMRSRRRPRSLPRVLRDPTEPSRFPLVSDCDCCEFVTPARLVPALKTM